MKQRIGCGILCLLLLLGCLAGCGRAGFSPESDGKAENGVAIVDAEGNRQVLPEDARVVACYGSFAHCWLLSGGELVGVTADAVEEHDLAVGDDVSLVGTVKSVDLEKVAELEPDYVILSADLTAQLALKENLKSMGIPFGYFRVDTFEDYRAVMEQFCSVNGRDDLYQTNVLEVGERIDAILERIPEECDKSVLLLRAYSTGMKAKAEDNLAGQILAEFGMKNLASESPSLLEELSVEQVILEDPDFIFISTMGSEEGALASLETNVESNPAWNGLTAVQSGHCVLLPKDLFHYKPNDRWDESYAYLAKIIYPELFGEKNE